MNKGSIQGNERSIGENNSFRETKEKTYRGGQLRVTKKKTYRGEQFPEKVTLLYQLSLF